MADRPQLAAANASRSAAAAQRDAQIARDLLNDQRTRSLLPSHYLAVAEARAAHPDWSWAQIGDGLGWSRHKVAGIWRRIVWDSREAGNG